MLFIAKGIAMCCALGVQLLLAKLGGAEGFGSWSLFLNLILIFSTLSDWGVNLNGARWVLEANGETWAYTAYYWRKRISILSALLLTVVIFVFYKNQWHYLVCSIPMVISYGYMSDWYYRGKQNPDKAALRQIIHSVGQLLGVAIVYFLTHNLWYAFITYSIIASLTYIVTYPATQNGFNTQNLIPHWLVQQSSILIGWVCYFITFNLPILLLSYVGKANEVGQYSSHYLLYTSFATLSVITMDIFIAKPQYQKQYKTWLFIFTLLAVVGIACSKWYYPILFSGKGFAWQSQQTLYMMLLCVIHAIRLYQINNLLHHKKGYAFGLWNVISLFIHLIVIAVGIYIIQQYDYLNAVVYLIIAEILFLTIYQWGKGLTNKYD